MKIRIITFFFYAVLTSLSSLSTNAKDETSYLPKWQEGCFDIHNIATGKGDATFIVMPDGTKMLIDAGDMTLSRFICPAYPSDSLTPGQWIARYIRHFSKNVPGKENSVDYFSLTHFHSDHMGNYKALKPGPHYGICGIMEVAEDIRFDKIVDRGYPNYDFPSDEYVLTKTNKAMGEYIKFVRWQSDSAGVRAEGFQVGSHTQFALKRKARRYAASFDVFNVAGGAYIADTASKGVRPMFKSDPLTLDENMFSTAILFRYGKFTYYNGGDMGGGSWGNYTDKRDFESQVADLVGPVTVMKADHHGWKEVMNPYLLWTMRPRAVFIQCSHKNHPWSDTVRRMLDPLLPVRPDIFVTTDAGREQVGEELFSKIKPAGHIVCRVYPGGESYEIFILDATSLDYHIIWRSGVQHL